MLWALVCVALIGIYLMQVGAVWTTQVQRAKEDAPLREGDAICRAIEAYVKADPGGAFPRSFDDLLRDSRVSFVRRYLREPYPDPMTSGEWQMVRGPGGAVRRVQLIDGNAAEEGRLSRQLRELRVADELSGLEVHVLPGKKHEPQVGEPFGVRVGRVLAEAAWRK